ncbi:uncharacterized protein ACO6RY_19668 [Pungitius sinensis]
MFTSRLEPKFPAPSSRPARGPPLLWLSPWMHSVGWPEASPPPDSHSVFPPLPPGRSLIRLRSTSGFQLPLHQLRRGRRLPRGAGREAAPVSASSHAVGLQGSS